jgi:iron complex outermembrane recepter protein
LNKQANDTYVDSETFNRTLDAQVPLQNFSKNSVNLTGIYEKGRVLARIAYDWRDKFHSGAANIVSVGALPIHSKVYGRLDASLSYRFSDKITLAIASANLFGTARGSYYGVETRPQNSWIKIHKSASL